MHAIELKVVHTAD